MPVQAPLGLKCVGAVSVCCVQCVQSSGAVSGFLLGRKSETRRASGVEMARLRALRFEVSSAVASRRVRRCCAAAAAAVGQVCSWQDGRRVPAVSASKSRRLRAEQGRAAPWI